jgi:hypothetical protein
VGSTSLKIASRPGNCGRNAVIAGRVSAGEMKAMNPQILMNATEGVLDRKRRLRAPGKPHHPRLLMTSGGGNSGRAAAGAVRIRNAAGAAFMNRRRLEAIEAQIMTSAALLPALSLAFAAISALLVYSVTVAFFWFAIALLYRSYKLLHGAKLHTASRGVT